MGSDGRSGAKWVNQYCSLLTSKRYQNQLVGVPTVDYFIELAAFKICATAKDKLSAGCDFTGAQILKYEGKVSLLPTHQFDLPAQSLKFCFKTIYSKHQHVKNGLT